MAEASNAGKFAYWMKVIMVFFIGWLVIWIYRTILSPIYPNIKETLGITTDAEMSMIPTVFYLFYTFFQIPSGLLADQFGRKKVVMTAFGIFATGVFTISMASSLTVVLTGAALVGMGQSAYFGCAYSITNANVPGNKRGLSSAIVNSGCAAGMAIGLIGSSYLVSILGIDWRILLRVLAFVIIAAVLFLGFNIRHDETTAPQIKGILKDKDQVGLLKIINNKKLIAAFVFYFAACYGYYSIITWLPAFLQSERNVHGIMIGYISSIVAFSSVPGALIISNFADKAKDKRIPILLFLQILSAVTLFSAVRITNIVLLVASLAVYGFFGKMAVDPIIVSYVVDFAPQKAYSRVLALLNFSGMSASILSSYSTGVLSDYFNTKAIGFYIACILLVLAAFILALANKNKPPRRCNLKEG